MSQVRSRQRVMDHGEVFTPPWMVEAMLDLVAAESDRIDSRFLEPACGSGNFLVAILKRKLQAVELQYGKSDFERSNYALLALMSLYGIEILEDNAEECRMNLHTIFTSFIGNAITQELSSAAKKVLLVNIVRGDALKMTCVGEESGPITFAEWAYLGKGKFKRRDFHFATLTQMSSFGEGTLFQDMGKHEIFIPVKEYPVLNVGDISNGSIN